MTADAEAHAEEDKKKRQLVETRNKADQLVWNTEKTLKEHGDKLGDADKDAITQAVEGLKQVKDGNDADAINSAIQTLEQAAHKLAEALYKAQAEQQAGASSEPGAGPDTGEDDSSDQGGPSGGDDVIDADYEVKD